MGVFKDTTGCEHKRRSGLRALARGVCLMLVACLVSSLTASGCANVRFERSPYAIRGLDVIYSEQEDVTFFIWRLRDEADARLVSFELHQDGDYRPIDLENTLYPAEAYECETHYLCFQYQLEGRYEWPDDVERPMRSIHEEEGLYAGSIPRPQNVETTITIDPIAIENNDIIDPRRFDWFAVNEIPFKREYQWQLVDSDRPDYKGGTAEECDDPSGTAWGLVTQGEPHDRIRPGSLWTDAPRCMHLRPQRTDDKGIILTAPFTPSAVLTAEQQDYLPIEERPPVIYLYLIDLLIKSDTRCENARQVILNRIDTSMGERTQNSVRLGTFTPTDPKTGRPLSGCEQRGDQDYPVRQIVEAVKGAAAELHPQNVRVVLVYLNNVELPPSNRILLQLYELSEELFQIENILPYPMAIGSNVVIGLLEWSYTVGWRPIDDETFVGDLKTWGETTLPFRTMLHDGKTEVRINVPVGAGKPERFKICSVTPSALIGVGFEPGGALEPPSLKTHPWPESGVPHYTVSLLQQLLLPNEEYERQPVSLRVEVCERFCDMPFRARSGADYENWQTEEVCQ